MLRLRQDAAGVTLTVCLGHEERPQFWVGARCDARECVVELAGDAGLSAAAALERGLTALAALRPARILFDMRRLRSLSSLARGVLASYARTQRLRGSDVEWVDGSGIVRPARCRRRRDDAQPADEREARPGGRRATRR